MSLWIVSGLLVMLLAGCLGGDDIDDDDGGDGSGSAQVSDDQGAIWGAVSSDIFEPLSGARIELLTMNRTLTDHAAQTDDKGEFTISHVEPGQFILFVTRVGYESNQRSVEVVAKEVTNVRFQLNPLARVGPWVEDFDRAGDVQYAYSYQVEVPTQGCIIGPTVPFWGELKTCGGSRGPSTAGETRVGPVEVPEGWSNSGTGSNFRESDLEDVKTIIVEMEWTPAGPFGETFLMDFMCSDMPRGAGGAILVNEHDCYFEARGESPLQHRVDEEHWLERDYNHTGTWAARVFATFGMLGTHGLTGVDIGLAYEQTFDIYWTVFHGEPAPEGYSRLPDS